METITKVKKAAKLAAENTTPQTNEQLAAEIEAIKVEENRKDDAIWSDADDIQREVAQNTAEDLRRDNELWKKTDDMEHAQDEMNLRLQEVERKISVLWNRIYS